jgi:arylsulfatase A-like enzyme
VLFIAIDDLRDWVGYLDDRHAHTPHLDRLAARGMAFTRSYCAAPVCNPSRTAILTGLRPADTGVYNNGDDWRTLVPEGTVRLPRHFKDSGYYVAGAGKIWHGSYPPPADDWDQFAARQGRRPADRGPSDEQETPPAPSQPWGFGNFKIGPLDTPDEQLADFKTVEFCLSELEKPHEKPFFLACGITKPHLPFTVPRSYFDLFPLADVELPPFQPDDLADIPPEGVQMARRGRDHARITEAGKWKEAIQAYRASIAFCDAMVGRLLDGLDQSAYRDNTIICLWSDHGWHLGEKEHWRKFALWEESTRSPLIWVVPGLTPAGSTCERTVDFMTIFPTLCDLCGLDTPPQLRGSSIRRLLADPQASWDHPAITTFGQGNHAVRTERWRYIRYAGGGEELYDHSSDPHEWKNVALNPDYSQTKTELSTLLKTAEPR